MNELIKNTCINSTYINNINPYTNFCHNDFLLVGFQKKQSSKPVINVSILTFPYMNIDYDEIENVTLSMYLKAAADVNSFPLTLRIIGNCDYLDISNVTYDNLQINNFCGETIVTINNITEKKLIEFDITAVINELPANHTDYNILIMPGNNEESYFEFSLLDSIPYLTISYKKNRDSNISHNNEEIIDSNHSINSNAALDFNNTLINDLHQFINERCSTLENLIEKNIELSKDFFNKLDYLSDKNSDLSSISKILTHNFEYFLNSNKEINNNISDSKQKIINLADKITMINNSLMSLDNTNLHLLEISKKFSYNTDSTENNINEQLEALNNTVNNILDILNHITIEPF